VRAMTDAFRDGGVDVRELRCDGGAAAMDLLLSLQATNSRVNVLRSSTLEATARGAASIAGLEIGMWRSLDELKDRWRATASFSPDEPLFVDLGYSSWRRALERA
jgi:glycerol kinase